MPRHRACLIRPVRIAVLALVAGATGFEARAEPPIKSAQDAACRAEARARVFSQPNPRGLEIEVLGKQIWTHCMRRAKRAPHRS